VRVAPGVAVGLVAITGCSWLGFEAEREPPDDLADLFGGPGKDPMGGPNCRLLIDDAELLAEFDDPLTGRHEWWSVPTAGGGRADVVMDFGIDETSTGSSGSLACTPDELELQGDEMGNDGLTWSGGAGTDTYVMHSGHAPDAAAVVRMTFRGHPPVDVEVQNGVYFTVLNESAMAEWSFPTRVVALDDDGAVIATWDGTAG